MLGKLMNIYNNKSFENNIKDMIFSADVKKIPDFLRVVEERLDMAGISANKKHNAIIVAEEIFSNISRYAYENENGVIQFNLNFNKENFQFIFKDNGKKFDPLKEKHPDIKVPLEEQQIGGWGIYLVRQLSQNVSYVYENSQNILTITFTY